MTNAEKIGSLHNILFCFLPALQNNCIMEIQCKQYFSEYNTKLFEGKLDQIELIWSNRMRVSAAIFYPDKHKPNEKGKICMNRRLLQTRSDKEIKETLLVRKSANSFVNFHLFPTSSMK